MFVDDINLNHQYFALTIRSHVANRRLKDIHCPALDSHYKLIRAADIPGPNQLVNSSVPILAADRLCYIGEPVAIITGPNNAKLEEIASKIIIETELYDSDEESPRNSPVFSITSANVEITAQIMLDMETPLKNVSVQKEKNPAGNEPAAPYSSENEADFSETSESEEANIQLKNEDVFVTGRYRTGIQEHWYSEPHGALAETSNDGITVHTATQWPDHVKQSVASALCMPASAVSVELAGIGLHFDGKLWYPSLIAVHAALAAVIIKRPVKL
ncbi:MAG: molybdopterin-dependent oxidoreductase, partial [Treponema sp.]|nr:molybdopterin-dependent oxidoreductase [Treponema sp.]